MCGFVLWWWLIFAAIFLSGAFGGLARHRWEVGEGAGKEGCLTFVLLGVAAAFLVPLFLNTISSSLLRDIPDEPNKLFILIGFCVAAGAFAKQFIGSVSEKALKLSKQASMVANEAKASANEASTTARSADNRAIALFQALSLIDKSDFEGALDAIARIIEDDPENAEAFAWQGYCLKRKGLFREAVGSMLRALEVEGREVHTWLYNLACYQCLDGATGETVVATLKRALTSASVRRRLSFKSDLQDDVDFDNLKQNAEFLDFLASI